MDATDNEGGQVVVATNEDGRTIKTTQKAYDVTDMAATGWTLKSHEVAKPRGRKAATVEADESTE